MKLKRKPRGLSDIRKGAPDPVTNLEGYIRHITRQNEDRAKMSAADPVTAQASGLGYSGPAMPDKGHFNGSCNRSACQLPGARMFMPASNVYYCMKCAADFDRWDQKVVRFEKPINPILPGEVDYRIRFPQGMIEDFEDRRH